MSDAITIRKLLITDEMKEQIAALRQASYDKKFGIRVTSDGLKWNLHDDESFHFGAFQNEKLISTLRLTRVETKARFESMLQYSSDNPFSSVPCYVLSRAATIESMSGQTINMQLRVLAFQFLISHGSPNEFLYGTALADSRRLKFLEELGYEMQFHTEPWKGYLDSSQKGAAVFRISIARLPSAILTIQRSDQS